MTSNIVVWTMLLISLSVAQAQFDIDMKLKPFKKMIFQESYESFKGELQKRRDEMEKMHQEKVSQLSPEAQAVDKKIVELFKNDNLTPKDRRKQLEKILDEQPKQIKKELKSIWKKCSFKGPEGFPFPQPPKFWRRNGGGAGFMRRLRWRGKPVDSNNNNTDLSPEDLAPPLEGELEQLEKQDRERQNQMGEVRGPVVEASSFRMSDDGYFVEV
ncbi:hypothetical protein WR25_25028 [Diploscapter pachys]|uniref:SXP/RAL-2 family protein Ani s 5-like cation-binding domain-containing protein n=1 Tax=Diploscapter pachys TaxID=2018661 RepID=A0A2A2JKM9_9BILA|nr:hypothetical protein WR25_25028 [Diploscapter pachys]